MRVSIVIKALGSLSYPDAKDRRGKRQSSGPKVASRSTRYCKHAHHKVESVLGMVSSPPWLSSLEDLVHHSAHCDHCAFTGAVVLTMPEIQHSLLGLCSSCPLRGLSITLCILHCY